MKMVKSLILGSAAGLLAMSGAQAADLPVKAKAVEYVRICSLYGAGFYYIPGTDTCIKLGGFLRVDVIAGGFNDFAPNLNGPGAAQNRLSNDYATRARQDLTIDTRTATEYGVLRTFAELVFSWSGGNYTGSSPSAYAGDGIGGGQFGIYNAFIQFAGFTAGRTYSIFDTPWQSYPAGGPDTLPGGGNHVTGVNTLIYTADFGQGISGSVAAQDQQAFDTTNIYNLSGATAAGLLTGAYGAPDIGGTRSPDLLASIRVDQAWGLAQVAVVAHDNHAAYYGPSEIFGHPDDKWGWAVMAGLSIKNIPTGPGDTINMQAVYTDGASRYNFQSLFPSALAMYGHTGLAGAYQSIGIAGVSDTVFTAGSGQESVTTWGFRGGYTHNWNPYWASAIYGAYAQLRYGSLGAAAICGNMQTLLGFVGTCNPNFNYGAIGINTIWTPVKNFAITGDVTWGQLDTKYSGVITAPAVAAVAKPAAVYQLKGENSVTMLLRAQRNF
jgi:Porin subfamily